MGWFTTKKTPPQNQQNQQEMYEVNGRQYVKPAKLTRYHYYYYSDGAPVGKYLGTTQETPYADTKICNLRYDFTLDRTARRLKNQAEEPFFGVSDNVVLRYGPVDADKDPMTNPADFILDDAEKTLENAELKRTGGKRELSPMLREGNPYSNIMKKMLNEGVPQETFKQPVGGYRRTRSRKTIKAKKSRSNRKSNRQSKSRSNRA